MEKEEEEEGEEEEKPDVEDFSRVYYENEIEEHELLGSYVSYV